MNIIYRIQNALLEIKWAYQRVVRGYDDTAVWSLVDYLSDIIPVITRKLKNGNCYSFQLPSVYGKRTGDDKYNKWHEILEDIAIGFEANAKIREEIVIKGDAEYEELNKLWKKGSKLFIKYFNELWD